MNEKLIICIFVFPLLSACLGSEDARNVIAVEEPSIDPKELILNGCEEWGTTAQVPGFAIPYDYPPNWNAKNDDETYLVYLLHYRCERIKWGPFERGPASLIFETFGIYDLPPGCHDLRARASHMLANIWISDSEIAQFARDSLEVPIQTLDSIQETKPSGNPELGAEYHEWTWNYDGRPNNLVNPTHNYSSEMGSYSMEYFWQTSTGLTRMLFEERAERAFPPIYLAHGSFNKPFIFSYMGSKYVGTNESAAYNESSITITEFGDTLCKSNTS